VIEQQDCSMLGWTSAAMQEREDQRPKHAKRTFIAGS